MIYEPFKVQAYGFGELAQLYLLNITKKSASWQLRLWINASKGLTEKLGETGYVEGRQLLTPMQVGLIVREFGEP